MSDERSWEGVARQSSPTAVGRMNRLSVPVHGESFSFSKRLKTEKIALKLLLWCTESMYNYSQVVVESICCVASPQQYVHDAVVSLCLEVAVDTYMIVAV